MIPSDNVPGVRGIGPKTAAALLERYGSLDAIFAHLDEVEPLRARQALRVAEAVAKLSRELVTIRTDLPARLDLRALAVREPDCERARQLFLELEFHSLLHELAPPRREAAHYAVMAHDEEVAALVRRAELAGRVAIPAAPWRPAGPGVLDCWDWGSLSSRGRAGA